MLAAFKQATSNAQAYASHEKGKARQTEKRESTVTLRGKPLASS